MPPWKAVGSSGGRKVSDLCCLGVWPVLVSLGSVSGIKSHKGGDSALALRGVTPGLGVRGPAHPLVVEDRVAPDLVRHDHSLESVGLKHKKCLFVSRNQLKHTVRLAIGIPPANETFFQVTMTTCLGSNVSVPTIDSLMSHFVLSLISTPN